MSLLTIVEVVSSDRESSMITLEASVVKLGMAEPGIAPVRTNGIIKVKLGHDLNLTYNRRLSDYHGPNHDGLVFQQSIVVIGDVVARLTRPSISGSASLAFIDLKTGIILKEFVSSLSLA